MAGKGTVTIRILGDASGFQKTVGTVEGGVGKMSSGFAKIAGAATAAFGAVGLAGALKDAVDEAREAAKVGRQTAAVIESTGGAAGVTAGHVGNLADRLSNLSGVDDELIQSAENVLLTFTNVGKQAFDGATTAALNMSAALGTDLQGATIQVGKALNDPIKGITALQRVGVSFTQQQRDQIKAMVAAGDTMGAQKLILGELNKEFGGAAEAAADPMQKLGVVVKNLEERVGTALLPIIDKAATWLGKNLPGALDFASRAFGKISDAVSPFIETLRLGISALVAAFKDGDVTSDGFVGTMERLGVFLREQVMPIVQQLVDFLRANWQPVMVAVGAAILLLISPFALVVAAVVAAYLKFQWFRDGISTIVDAVVGFWDRYRTSIMATLQQVADLVASVFDAVKVVIETWVKVISDLWDRFGHTLLDKLRVAFEAITQILQGALTFLSGVFDLIKAILTGKWGDAWEAIKKILSGAWEAVLGILRLGIDALSAVFEAAKAVISAAWSALWHGIATIVTDVVIDPAKAAFDSLVGFVTGLPGRITKAASGMWDGIKDAFKSAINFIIRGWNGLQFSIPGFNVGPVHFGGFTLGVPNIPYLAQGGIVTGPTLAVLGEAGPEAVVPLSRRGGMGDTYISLTVEGHVLTVQDLVDAVHTGLIEKTRRNPTLQLA